MNERYDHRSYELLKGLIAQQRTGNAKVMGSNPVEE